MIAVRSTFVIAGYMSIVGCGGGDGGMSDDGGRRPRPIVGDCSALGEVGVWEEITPIDIDHSVATPGLLVDPNNLGTVYVGMFIDNAGFHGAGIWRTDDCGATWRMTNTGENGARVDSMAAMMALIDPIDSQVLYAVGYGESLYRSANGGTDWTNISPTIEGVPTWVQWVAMDPTDNEHLVVTLHNNCEGAYAPMCMAESLDAGETWRAFRGPPSLTGWQEGAGPVVLGKKTMMYTVPFVGAFWSDDSGATWEQVITGSGCQAAYARDGSGTHYMGCLDGMYQSDDGHAWTRIDGAPRADAIVLAGDQWFSSMTNDYSGAPFHTAPASDLSTWTTSVTPTLPQGASAFGYDPEHHVVYASAMKSGVWRMRMQ